MQSFHARFPFVREEHAEAEAVAIAEWAIKEGLMEEFRADAHFGRFVWKVVETRDPERLAQAQRFYGFIHRVWIKVGTASLAQMVAAKGTLDDRIQSHRARNLAGDERRRYSAERANAEREEEEQKFQIGALRARARLEREQEDLLTDLRRKRNREHEEELLADFTRELKRVRDECLADLKRDAGLAVASLGSAEGVAKITRRVLEELKNAIERALPQSSTPY